MSEGIEPHSESLCFIVAVYVQLPSRKNKGSSYLHYPNRRHVFNVVHTFLATALQEWIHTSGCRSNIDADASLFAVDGLAIVVRSRVK
jgi:hypothetical protein